MTRSLYYRSTIASLFLVAGLTAVHAQEETQTFDSAESTEAAGWVFNDEGQSSERECPDVDCETDLGWKSSNEAGGDAAGEGGGLMHRSGQLPIGFYGDTTIGELNLDMPISARGKLALVNIDFDGHAHLGFFDGARLLADPLDYGAELGFLIAEPGGGVAPNFRWGQNYRTDGGVANRSNAAFVEGVPDGESIDFLIEYNPEGGDGFGAVTLTIGDDDPFELILTEDERNEGATLTSFGVHTGPHLGSADPRSLEMYIDDVTYTSLDVATTPGDFNNDGVLDAMDIDLLGKEVVAATNDVAFDLTGDNLVNQDDRTEWVSNLKKTWIGDANLDGEFNSGDFVEVFTAGQYEDDEVGNSGWATGDWSGDMEFDSADFVVAFTEGGYETGPKLAAAAVPEPTAAFTLLIGCCCLTLAQRQNFRRQ